HMRVEQVQAGRGAPVPEQPGLDVLESQRLAQQRVVTQVDLPDREGVGSAPVCIQRLQLGVGEDAGRGPGHTCRMPAACLAISISSSVGNTSTATSAPAAEMTGSLASLRCGSIAIPKRSIPASALARTGAACSPTPAVKTIASTRPSTA